MPRLLLLLPTETYRTADFVRAAGKLSIDLTIATEETSTFEAREPADLLTLNFNKPEEAAEKAAVFGKQVPLDAVLGVDDATSLVAAEISRRLSLPHNPPGTAWDTLDKFRMRKRLAEKGISVPKFRLVPFSDNPAEVIGEIPFPCVLKPLNLSGGRGVIRADTPPEFIRAFKRIRGIVRESDRIIPDQDGILVEQFIQGEEIAVEGIIIKGRVYILAIFDKPDPLNGPFFPETIYLTPSRQPALIRNRIVRSVKKGLSALGLGKGPFHAELRIHDGHPRIIEIASRSIGGHCSRALRFRTPSTLEELVLREALGLKVTEPKAPEGTSGVMMLPVPKKGIIKEISGISDAREIPGIREVDITAHPGQRVFPLPEGKPSYLGFIFGKGGNYKRVEEALRTAARRIRFHIKP